MNELNRLKELYNYNILDTSSEKELDELAEIASAICETPISLVSLIDDHRQWFKAVKGLNLKQTPREDSFCQHALHKPKEVFVVEDTMHDERFTSNPLVLGNPNIRFYAGAPLETPSGHVLGTLCIIDNKPRQISENQKKALQLLAKKVMEHLNTKKLLQEQQKTIDFGVERLLKLSDEAPGAIYQLEMQPDGRLYFPFISKGFTELHPDLEISQLKENAEIAFSVVHPDDLEAVKESLQTSYTNLTIWDLEYRVITEEGDTIWHWAKANPEKKHDGTVVWYGTFQDITTKKEYRQTLEQILFDISHVMRRPVANMLGLTTAITKDNLDQVKLLKSIQLLKTASEEMDSFIKKLNADYTKLKSRFAEKIKFPLL